MSKKDIDKIPGRAYIDRTHSYDLVIPPHCTVDSMIEALQTIPVNERHGVVKIPGPFDSAIELRKLKIVVSDE